MSSVLDALLESVKASVLDHTQQQPHTGFDAGGLLTKITDLFSAHKQQHGDRDIASASQDPYGDPGAGGGGRASVPGNVKSASQDPYGDPADQGSGRRQS